MLDIKACFWRASLFAFLLAAPSRQAQIKTPPKAAIAATPRVVPTMALETPMLTLLDGGDVEVDEADDVVSEAVDEVDAAEVLVASARLFFWLTS
jgi:hypothetical protein